MQFLRSVKKVFTYVAIALGLAMVVECCLLLIPIGSSKYYPTYLFSSPSYYTELFNDSAKHQISLHVTNAISGRNPISEYIYDDRISIVVHKIDVPASVELDSLLVPNLDRGQLGFFQQYCALNPGQLKMSYRRDSVGLVKRIVVSFSGDSISRVFKNRNLISLKMLLGKLQIQYDKKGLVDLTVEKYWPGNSKVPIEMTFLKQNAAVFLIFISPTFSNDIDVSGFSRKILNETFFR